MKKETLEKAAERYAEGKSSSSVFQKAHIKDFIEGAKWQQERDREFYFKYIKSEKDFQIPRIAKLGINTTGQCFEQMVTSLIHLGERSYSEEEVLTIAKDAYTRGRKGLLIGVFNKWLEQFKKK